MEQDISHLPPSAQRLIGIIGLQATLIMVDKHGGKTLRLYQTGETMELLAGAIGTAAAGALFDYFGIEPFIVPKCRAALNDVRNARIHAEYDRLTREERRSGRDSVHRLVEKFGLAERQVWRILKRSSQAAAPREKPLDPRQMSLI